LAALTVGVGLVLADLRSDSYPLLLLPSAEATALVGAGLDWPKYDY
jgi:hypothetical protein